METVVKACAKINLTLDITGKREDGYHEVKTIMQSVSLCDYVTLVGNSSGEITISCDKPFVPCDESNIAVKCAKAFFGKTGIANPGLHIDIQKNIPAQAGLAGGSADGAAVITGLNEMYGRPLDKTQSLALGAEIGADIPFCIMGGTALGEGIGTSLTALPPIPHCYFVLVKPPVGISTKEAFAAVDSAEPMPFCATDRMIGSLGDAAAIAACLRNDFEDTLHNEELLALKSRLLECSGVLGAVMTGSGSTVYAILDSRERAKACAEMFFAEYDEVYVAEDTSYGTIIQ